MRIGLLTYHHSANYGAVMQSYATCRALKELGHEVEFINFRQDEKRSNSSIIFYFKIKVFDRFMETFYPSETKVIQSMDDLNAIASNYDCLMVGSDQVWNPGISQSKCLAYFLDFGESDIRRISYASSFGISKWPEQYQSLLPSINSSLHRFCSISVREETGKYLLNSLFKLNSQVVLDPTLLHADYNEITGSIVNNDEVICYLLNRGKLQLEKTIRLSRSLGKTPKMISTIRPTFGFRYVYPPSIENWIRYIAGAKFVITDSFHGLAFSLIYNKQFVVISPSNGKNSRLKDLLKSVSLEDRYFDENDPIIYRELQNKKIDYNKVNSMLEILKKVSWDYLKNALQ